MSTPAALEHLKTPVAYAPGTPKSWLERAIAAPLVRRFVYGAAWNTLATTASRALTLLAMIYVARTLGRELYGRMATVQNTMGMFGVFAGCGLGIASTKFVAEFRRNDPARAGRIIAWTQMTSAGLGACFALLCLILSPWLAAHVLAEPQLARPLQFGCLLVFCNTLQGVQSATLAGFEAFQTSGIVAGIGGVCTLAFTALGVAYAGLDGAVLGLVAAAAIQVVVAVTAVCRLARAEGAHLDYRAAWQESGPLLRYSLPVAISALVVMPTDWVVTALLANQPGGYAQLGLYNAAAQWFNAIMLVPMIVGQAALPILSERYSEGDRRGFLRLLAMMVASNFAAVFPLVAGGWWASGWLMTRNGAEFADGAVALCLLLTATLVIALMVPVGNSLQATGRSGVSLCVNLAWAVTYICLAGWFIESGATGVAWARLLAYIALTVWVSGYVLFVTRTEFKTAPLSQPAA